MKKIVTLAIALMIFAVAATVGASPGPNDLLYGVNSADDGLSVIDPSSGAVTFLRPLHPDPDQLTTPIAMAARPSDGKLFVWNNSNFTKADIQRTGVLLTVDTCTGLGTATQVDPTTPDQGLLQALAFAPSGKLFGLEFSLFDVDPVTGVKASIGALGLRVGAADFDAGGTLFGVELTTANTQRLVTVDTTTGAANVVSALSFDIGRVGSIVFDSNGTLIGSGFGGTQGNILFDIDPTNGNVSTVRSITGGFAPQGLGFGPSCSGGGIDIKPHSNPNSINTKSRGTIPVAILSTPDFDATIEVDKSSLTFGRTGDEESLAKCTKSNEDVNDDGLEDVVCHFNTQDTGFQQGDTEGILKGKTIAGEPFEESDSVRIVK